jgi:hypothetical protein
LRQQGCQTTNLSCFKGRVHLRYDLRFDLRFGACVGTPTQDNALPGCVTCQRRHRIIGQIAGRIALYNASGPGPVVVEGNDANKTRSLVKDESGRGNTRSSGNPAWVSGRRDCAGPRYLSACEQRTIELNVFNDRSTRSVNKVSRNSNQKKSEGL